MSDLDWSTPEGLAAIREHLAARDRRLAPAGRVRRGAQPRVVVAGVGVRARQRPGRAARAARRGARDACSATTARRPALPLSRAELAAAVESLAPAEACTALDHPNLAAWREVLAELEGTRRARRRPCSWPTSTTRSPRRPTARCAPPSRGTPPDLSSGARRAPSARLARCCCRTGRAPPPRSPARPPRHPDRPSGGPAVLDASTTLLEAGAAAPWVLRVVLLIAVGDALLPPMPSEGVVVALAAVAVAGDGPHLALLALVAAVGGLPRRHPHLPRRPPVRPAAARAGSPARGPGACWSGRPPPSSDAARSSCSPRATCRSAGSPSTSRPGPPASRRAGSPAWPRSPPPPGPLWSVGVGALAGHWLDGNPLLGSAAGIALALGLGLAVDRVARRLTGWGRMPDASRHLAVVGDAPRPGGRRRPAERARSPFALSTRECQ